MVKRKVFLLYQCFHFQNRKLMPKFVLKDMEGLYIEEMNTAINTLKGNLESLPVDQKPSAPKSTMLPKSLGRMKPRWSEMVFSQLKFANFTNETESKILA